LEEQTDPQLKTLQDVVSQKMGRCIIRLQQYEHLIKRVLAVSDIRGYPEDGSTDIEQRHSRFATKTLGHLVGELTKTYIRPRTEDGNDFELDTKVAADPSRVHFRVNFKIEMDGEGYDRAKAALSELVALRNDLMHHFIARFKLFSSAGCEAAAAYLDDAYQLIAQRHQELITMAKDTDQLRRAAVDSLMSDAVGDMIDGIMPSDAEPG